MGVKSGKGMDGTADGAGRLQFTPSQVYPGGIEICLPAIFAHTSVSSGAGGGSQVQVVLHWEVTEQVIALLPLAQLPLTIDE